MAKRNITAAWAVTSLFLFDPDRVLRKTPKPPTEGNEANIIGSCSTLSSKQDSTLLITPVTTEATNSLHDLMKRKASALGDKHS